MVKNELISLVMLLPILLTAQVGGNDFIKQNSLMTDSADVIDHINEFFYSDLKKGSLKWFKGRIVTKEKIVIEDLELNFNVFNNTLYVKRSNDIYKVSGLEISEFQIFQDGRWHIFKKGYGVPFLATLDVSSSAGIQEMLDYFSSYPKFHELSFDKISISESRTTDLRIRIYVAFKDDVFALKKFLEKNEKVVDVIANYSTSTSSITVNTFLEVLYVHQHFEVIKYHFKRNVFSDGVSLNENSNSFMFDEEDYFFANKDKLLSDFLFTKNSIQKALSSIGIKPIKKIKRIGNEEKVVRWCANAEFDLMNEI